MTTFMIDCTSPKTIPKELYEIIIDKIDQLVIEYNNERKYEIEKVKGLIPVFDQAPPRPVYMKVLESLEKVFTEYDFIGYHCSKLMVPEIIKEEGLRILEPEFHLKSVLNQIKNHLTKKERADFLKSISTYIQEQKFENRDKKLRFIGNKDMKNDYGCEDFFKYLGGEICYRRAGKDYKGVLERLGTPVLIKCILNGYNLNITSSISQELIRYYINKSVGIEDKIEWEGYVTKDILPEHILGVEFL